MKERPNEEHKNIIQQRLFELDEDGNIIIPWDVEPSEPPLYTPEEIEDLFKTNEENTGAHWVINKWG